MFDAGITIEDNLAALVDYDTGATMSYSLNAHAPWEGYRVTVNGTEGRAELEVVERGAVLIGDDGRVVVDPSMTPGYSPEDEVRPDSERLVRAAALGGRARRADPRGHRQPRRRRRVPARPRLQPGDG